MMLSLPDPLMALLSIFAPLFSKPVWNHVQVLRAGAILCQGPHPVAAVLRVMGLEGKHAFCKYHRVLSRDRWSGWHGSKILFGRLVVLVRAAGVPLRIVIDETLDRRQGKRIKAKGNTTCQ